MSSKKIVACIVTFNRKEKLKNCIEALLAQVYIDFKIVIVDNASTDGTQSSLAEYIKDKKIEYYNTGKNLGGAGGFNYAIKNVVFSFDYIWIMDDDTYPKPDALQNLVKHIGDVNDRFGFFSSLAEWTDENACLMNKQALEDDIFGSMRVLEAGLIPAKNASFVSLFIKSDMVKKVGLPIKDFFLWGDDTEYTQRLSVYGGYIVIDSVVVHDMATNDGVDILNSDFKRVQRYSLFVRNRMFIAKLSGNKGEMIRAYISPFKQCIRVFFKAKDNRIGRMKITMEGFWKGLSFSPEIEYVENV